MSTPVHIDHRCVSQYQWAPLLVGRNTQGVKLINLTKNEKLVGLERVLEEDDDSDSEADETDVLDSAEE